MNVQRLLQGIEVNAVNGSLSQTISGIAYHTKQVKAGSLFVAIPGHAADGHDFIPTAVATGAVAIVSHRRVALPDHVANVVVPDARAALAALAARWYAEPSRHVRLVGVTGTNGKTTITYLLESIWRAAGRSPGVLGTINIRYATVHQPAPTTTPESLDLQQWLRAMVEAHVEEVAMEVSSHALDQGRVTGCHFDGAIFTNLTQDHLDYHGTMERYGMAKRRLFHEVLPGSAKAAPWAVINADDPAGALIANGCPVRVVRYTLIPQTAASVVSRPSSVPAVTGDRRPATGDTVYASGLQCTVDGIRMEIAAPTGRYVVQSALRGRFNASNILAAAAAAYAMGLPASVVQEGVRTCAIVPGRLEPVPNRAGLTVLVDYAHTPDALRNILLALRELHPRRIVTVFGCGGDRDPGKRSLMGVEVARGSDCAIVTSDNPRTEDPHTIIAQIIPGLQACGWQLVSDVDAGRRTQDARWYCVITDRREAIHAALRMARRGEIVVIAGKGHEDYQIIGTEKRRFDDREVVREFFCA